MRRAISSLAMRHNSQQIANAVRGSTKRGIERLCLAVVIYLQMLKTVVEFDSQKATNGVQARATLVAESCVVTKIAVGESSAFVGSSKAQHSTNVG